MKKEPPLVLHVKPSKQVSDDEDVPLELDDLTARYLFELEGDDTPSPLYPLTEGMSAVKHLQRLTMHVSRCVLHDATQTSASQIRLRYDRFEN